MFNCTHLAVAPIMQHQIRCGAERTGFAVALFTPTICSVAYFPSIFNYSWGTSSGVASLTVLLTDQRVDLASHADQRQTNAKLASFPRVQSAANMDSCLVFQQFTCSRYLLFYFIFILFYHVCYSAYIE